MANHSLRVSDAYQTYIVMNYSKHQEKNWIYIYLDRVLFRKYANKDILSSGSGLRQTIVILIILVKYFRLFLHRRNRASREAGDRSS